MLELKKVKVKQGQFQLEASFTVEKGSFTAIVGASGSGKSTLLSTIAGFLKPIEGKVIMSGEDVTKLPPGKRPMSILFQDNNLFPHLNVKDNLHLGVSEKINPTADQKLQIEMVLESVGLSDKGLMLPAELSGGEQARVAFARALLRARPILLLDEPFAALDRSLKDRMLELVDIYRKKHDITVLMVTHDALDKRGMFNNEIEVSDGVIVTTQ